MNKCPLYFVKNKSGRYLQGVDANDHYCRTGVAPTMGVRHSYYEFKTIWGDKPHPFDYRTLGGYIKVILEENQWDDNKKPQSFSVVPCDESGNKI